MWLHRHTPGDEQVDKKNRQPSSSPREVHSDQWNNLGPRQGQTSTCEEWLNLWRWSVINPVHHTRVWFASLYWSLVWMEDPHNGSYIKQKKLHKAYVRSEVLWKKHTHTPHSWDGLYHRVDTPLEKKKKTKLGTYFLQREKFGEHFSGQPSTSRKEEIKVANKMGHRNVTQQEYWGASRNFSFPFKVNSGVPRTKANIFLCCLFTHIHSLLSPPLSNLASLHAPQPKRWTCKV